MFPIFLAIHYITTLRCPSLFTVPICNSEIFQFKIASLETWIRHHSISVLILDQSPYRLLLDSVYELQDNDGRLIWEMFEELPSRQV